MEKKPPMTLDDIKGDAAKVNHFIQKVLRLDGMNLYPALDFQNVLNFINREGWEGTETPQEIYKNFISRLR